MAPVLAMLFAAPATFGAFGTGPLPAEDVSNPAAGTLGGPGLALRAKKALTAELEGRQVIDDALVLIRDGRIEAVGRAGDLEAPADYELEDLGDLWLMPGMVDLHSHVGGSGGINDMVYQANPGLRVTPTVINDNRGLQRAIASGVTTILFIPGSGTNIGGQGVLMKTGLAEYEQALVRDPGSLKIAQGDNPTRWGYGMGRLLMNFHLRSTIRRGLAYARRWKKALESSSALPERDLQLDVFRALEAKTTQVSTHTQYYQLVMMSIRMLAVEFGLDVYIDHGSFDSFLNSERAEAAGVAADSRAARGHVAARAALRHRRPGAGVRLGLPAGRTPAHRFQHGRPGRAAGRAVPAGGDGSALRHGRLVHGVGARCHDHSRRHGRNRR